MAFLMAVFLLAFAGPSVFAQPDDGEAPLVVENDPRFSRWQYYADVNLPKDPAPGTKFGVLDIPGQVIGKAAPDLADLRLADAEGKRIPYALRVQRASTKQTPIAIDRAFDAGPIVKDRAFEESFELAAVPLPGHNEIEIQTSGENFRRLVQVLGSNTPDFANAQALLPPNTYLVRFQAEGRPVVVERFRYQNKLFRFLKVRIDADRYNGEKAPKIERVVVYQSEKTAGKYLTYPVRIEMAEGVRGEGGPATAYTVELGDEHTYCEKLTLNVETQKSVERPFRLHIANRGQVREEIGGVNWRWRKVDDQHIVELTFPEVNAQTLRLVITDFENPRLKFSDATGTMAARQLFFEWPDPAKTPPPFKLFFGYPQANAPRYDLDQRLPNPLDPPAAVAAVGPRVENPSYTPPPRDFSERYPWAVYIVLGLASLVLAGLLVPLAKEALARAKVAPVE